MIYIFADSTTLDVIGEITDPVALPIPKGSKVRLMWKYDHKMKKLVKGDYIYTILNHLIDSKDCQIYVYVEFDKDLRGGNHESNI